jgi:hypothetical protein
MARSTHVLRPRRSWLTLLVAILATTAQLTVALAPLAEGRESRLASHVEAGGSTGHYAHDDTKCISCQARSMNGTVERPALPPLPGVLSSMEIGTRVRRIVADQRGRPANPRAPPTIQV